MCVTWNLLDHGLFGAIQIYELHLESRVITAVSWLCSLGQPQMERGCAVLSYVMLWLLHQPGESLYYEACRRDIESDRGIIAT